MNAFFYLGLQSIVIIIKNTFIWFNFKVFSYEIFSDIYYANELNYLMLTNYIYSYILVNIT